MLILLMDMAETPEQKTKLEKLYMMYDRMMYQVAYRILYHHQDTEDVLMAAWIKITSNLSKIDEIDCPQTKSFIVIIVEREAIDQYRRNKRKREEELDLDFDESTPILATEDKALEQIEFAEMMRTIPKKYAEVLSYHYMNGMTTQEISKLTDTPHETVKKRLQRGRAMIAKEMGLNE